eukprot:scaffold24005_cov59-Phaeocystis_antarctica.AAC.3
MRRWGLHGLPAWAGRAGGRGRDGTLGSAHRAQYDPARFNTGSSRAPCAPALHILRNVPLRGLMSRRVRSTPRPMPYLGRRHPDHKTRQVAQSSLARLVSGQDGAVQEVSRLEVQHSLGFRVRVGLGEAAGSGLGVGVGLEVQHGQRLLVVHASPERVRDAHLLERHRPPLVCKDTHEDKHETPATRACVQDWEGAGSKCVLARLAPGYTIANESWLFRSRAAGLASLIRSESSRSVASIHE